jgi:hypothetical protein
VRKINIDSSNGAWFVDTKIKMGLEYMTSRSKTGLYLVNGFSSYLPRMDFQTLLKRKYIGSKALSQIFWKLGDSHSWAGLMALNKFFFCYGTFSINDGSQIHFWEDIWLDNAPLQG